MRNTNFFMLPLGWYRFPEISGLPAGAMNVWVGLVEHCWVAGNGGVMTSGEVTAVARSFARGTASVRALIERGTLLVQGPFGAETTVVRVSNPARWMLVSNPRKAIPAGEDKGVANSGVAASRARVKRDREIEREEERTPSGSVRSSSARAAPRSAGGAARPALDDPEPGGNVLGDDQPKQTRAEIIAAARKAIRDGQKNGPATGRDIQFSRYDPNRRIVPLTSGFKIDGGAE